MLELVVEESLTRKLKKLSKKHYDMKAFYAIVNLLISSTKLPGKYKDHALSGDLQGCRECHIEPDWLLVYKVTESKLVLVATGSHDELFR